MTEWKSLVSRWLDPGPMRKNHSFVAATVVQMTHKMLVRDNFFSLSRLSHTTGECPAWLCRAGPNSRGWSAQRSFRIFSQPNVVEGQNLDKSLSVCWRTGLSKNIETFCRLCRCFCKDKPVESVILSGRIKSRLSSLLFKNLVLLLFLKYSFSHMVSTLWWTLQN